MKERKININIKEHRHILIKLCFFVVLIGTAAIVFWHFLNGEYMFIFYDVGSDTREQYYPYYVNMAMKLREGDSGIWNWDYGIGTSLMNNISQTLDPFGIFVIMGGALFGVSKISYILLIVQILKIIISAQICKKYLELFKISEFAACIGAYLYGFNGYLMLWGQHYLLGTGCVYLVLILYVVEKVIRSEKKKWAAYLSIVVCLSLIYSYYNTYMILLFAGVYFIIRVFEPGRFKNWKHRITKMVQTLLSVMIGVLMSGFVLIPAAYYLFSVSSRLNSNESALVRFVNFFFSRYSFNDIMALLSRGMSNNLLCINFTLPVRWVNYYELPNISLTVFIYIFLSQLIVLIYRQRREKKRVIYYIFCIFVSLFILFNQGVALAFNGFMYPQGRYMFVILPTVGLGIGIVWDQCVIMKRICIPGVFLGVLFSLGIFGYCSLTLSREEVIKPIILFVISIFAFAFLMLLSQKSHDNIRLCCITGMCVLIFVSTVYDAYITNNYRSRVTKDMIPFQEQNGVFVNNTIKIVDELQREDKLVRMDKTYSDFSKFGDSLIERYSGVTNYNSTGNKNMNEFFSKLYSESNSNAAYQNMVLENESDLMAISLLNMQYILTKEEMNIEGLELVKKINGIFVYKNSYAEGFSRWYTSTISREECESMTEEERRDVVMSMAIVEKQNDKYQTEKKGKKDIGNFVLESNSSIRGSIRVEEKGILMLSIPDQQGWEIKVDGKGCEAINVNYGFLAVELEPGQHNIEADYSIPMFEDGIMVSVIGLCMFALLYIIPWNRIRKYKGDKQ